VGTISDSQGAFLHSPDKNPVKRSVDDKVVLPHRVAVTRGSYMARHTIPGIPCIGAHSGDDPRVVIDRYKS
jgi:hypothetical protein